MHGIEWELLQATCHRISCWLVPTSDVGRVPCAQVMQSPACLVDCWSPPAGGRALLASRHSRFSWTRSLWPGAALQKAAADVRCKWGFWNSHFWGVQSTHGMQASPGWIQCATSLGVKHRCCPLRHLNQCHPLHSHVLLVAHQFPQISLLCCYQTRTGED